MAYRAPSKNEYVLLKVMFNEDLHKAVMKKDSKTVEQLITDENEEHQKHYNFSMYDTTSELDIDYVKTKYQRELRALEREEFECRKNR